MYVCKSLILFTILALPISELDVGKVIASLLNDECLSGTVQDLSSSDSSCDIIEDNVVAGCGGVWRSGCVY